MRKILIAALPAVVVLALVGSSQGSVVDFNGGTAYLQGGGTVVTDNVNTYSDVDYYVEDGVKFDFVGGLGIVGDYYAMSGHDPLNAVIHAHWGPISSIVVSKEDGSSFDLNYMDVTSNTTVGGDKATGLERSFVTASNGYSMLLPSSDWGFDWTYYGAAGDGVKRLWLDANFDSITSFTVTSENAYCFGLDNFYIDEPPPPNPTATPEPTTLIIWSLLGAVGFGFGWMRKCKAA